ncbi:MAG: malonate transporter subunit MadL [Chloroflexi bacterium]|nr:malonate transporter subunit MadL [Chloroflexota bacterium]
MVIYGVALLAFCFITGLFLGDLLGRWIGIEANLGGVGFAMLLLIGLSAYLKKKILLPPITEQGITFWSAIYIPIVVAMAAKQNVFMALDAGGVAIVSGFLAVLISFLLIPLLTKVGKNESTRDY